MERIRSSGGYRDLKSFQTVTIVYDATYSFCENHIPKYSRTIDQMVQAARSGRQNIAEGSRAAATSSQTELRLVNVARASLEELLLDYEDFIRQRKKQQWQKRDTPALAVRQVATDHRSDWTNLTDDQRRTLYANWLDSPDPFVQANCLICLIHQTNYLLDRQIVALEKQFVQEGGYSEILASKRLQHRANPNNQSDQSNQSDLPTCPNCQKPMVLRTAKNGKSAGKQFLGCSAYPECKGIVNL